MKLCAGRPHKSTLLAMATATVLAASILIAGTVLAGTQGVKLRYVPNEYIIHVQPGTSITDVQSQVSRLGASLVEALPVNDTYLIRLGQARSTATASAVPRGTAGLSLGGPLTEYSPTSWTILVRSPMIHIGTGSGI